MNKRLLKILPVLEVLLPLVAVLVVPLLPGLADTLCAVLAVAKQELKDDLIVSIRNLGLVIGGFVGIGLATWRSIIASAQARTAQQGHITDRFSKAVEHLGSENVSVRIGGIYALKRIAQDSPERDYIAVMDVLCNFIRYSPYAVQQREAAIHAEKIEAYEQKAKKAKNNRNIVASLDEKPAPLELLNCPDLIAAIESVRLGTKETKAHETMQSYNPVLNHANLAFLHLEGTNFSGFQLTSANFRRSNLDYVDFSRTTLNHANFEQAKGVGTKFTASTLMFAHLKGVILTHADFTFANLWHSDLTSASLHDSNFTNATLADTSLANAMLIRVTLINADLNSADLTNADLMSADLSNADLLDAHFEGIILTDVFTRPGQAAHGLHDSVVIPEKNIDLREAPEA